MMSISKEFRFEAAHRLPLHEGACKNIHGHSYRLVVHISGNIQCVGPATDMVIDFQKLTGVVKDILEIGTIYGRETVPFDHSVILWEKDPLLKVLDESILAGEIPNMRIVRLVSQPTAEYMAELFASMIQDGLNNADARDISVTNVEVWETSKACAYWSQILSN